MSHAPPIPLAVPNSWADRILHVAAAVLDTGAPTTDTKGFEWDVRVASGRDEVEAAVDARVGDALLPVDVDLLLQVFLILVIDELHNRLPAAWRPWLAEPVPMRGRVLSKPPKTPPTAGLTPI